MSTPQSQSARLQLARGTIPQLIRPAALAAHQAAKTKDEETKRLTRPPRSA